jgi:hypothetical protein
MLRGAVGSPLLSDCWCLRAFMPLSLLSFFVISSRGILNLSTFSRALIDDLAGSGEAALSYSILNCITFLACSLSCESSFGLTSVARELSLA